MKKLFSVFVSIIVLLFAGCAKKPVILFCEGVSPDGEGINCGTRFETGELTTLIVPDSPFDTDRLDLLVMEGDGKGDPMENISLEVQPEKSRTSTNLSFYSSGTYTVRVLREKEIIGEASINIVDFQAE